MLSSRIIQYAQYPCLGMHFHCRFCTPGEFVPTVAFQLPSVCRICAIRGRTMGRYDRPIQGMAWLPHLAPGCGRGWIRGLFRGFVV
jgi:hypothetical protein